MKYTVMILVILITTGCGSCKKEPQIILPKPSEVINNKYVPLIDSLTQQILSRDKAIDSLEQKIVVAEKRVRNVTQEAKITIARLQDAIAREDTAGALEQCIDLVAQHQGTIIEYEIKDSLRQAHADSLKLVIRDQSTIIGIEATRNAELSTTLDSTSQQLTVSQQLVQDLTKKLEKKTWWNKLFKRTGLTAAILIILKLFLL